MKELFKKVTGLLKTSGSKKWVDKDKGQIDKYVEKPWCPIPCALIKISILSAEDMGDGSQQCKARIDVRLAYDLLKSETSAAAPDEAWERSFAYYDDIKAAYISLQGFTDDEVNEFDRTSCIEEDRFDGLAVVKMSFTTEFIDTSAKA